MQNFEFALPTRVVFGPGSVDTVGYEVAVYGRRALLVTGSTFAQRSGLVDRMRGTLAEANITTFLLDHLEQNPTVETIDRGGATAREVQAEVVIGLGGGSALDAAKAVAVAARIEGSIWDYAERRKLTGTAEVTDCLPVVQVPIIASTGSETNNTAVIFNGVTRSRMPLSSHQMYPRLAIVDPALTFSVPARYTAVGAMNIVSQMLETYLTSDEFAVTDRVSEGLVRVVMDSLSRAMRNGDDLDARSNLSWAATMASTVALAGRGGTMPVRTLAYPLTAHYGIEHGCALAALWPSFMRYSLANRQRLPQIGRFKRYALLGRQIFGVHETDDEVAAETTMYRFTHWLKSMDMPTDLVQLGVNEDDFAEMASQAVSVSGDGRRLATGLTAEDVQNVYEGALRVV